MSSMTANTFFQILLRLLPCLAVLGLAFVAAADAKTRERWAELLYQMGSLRPEQRSDPRVQCGVRLPFFIVAFLLLIWPIRYYFYATRTIQVSPQSDLVRASGPTLGQPAATATGNAATGNAAVGNAATGNAAGAAPQGAPASPRGPRL